MAEHTEFEFEEPAPTEGDESVNPYTTWVTIAGLILALSMLGSLIFRAFPPRVIFNSGSSSRGGASSVLPVTVRVRAGAAWVDSGVQLEANSNYRLQASGQVVLSAEQGFDDPVGPQGFSSRCRPVDGQSCALSGAPYGALIGKLDDGEPFLIGQVLVLETSSSGRLWLAVNDLTESYEDNSGVFELRLAPFEDDRFDSANGTVDLILASIGAAEPRGVK